MSRSPVNDHTGLCPVTGKRMYSTRSRAKKAAKVMRHDGHMRQYRCLHCGYFHIGHPGSWSRADHRAAELRSTETSTA